MIDIKNLTDMLDALYKLDVTNPIFVKIDRGSVAHYIQKWEAINEENTVIDKNDIYNMYGVTVPWLEGKTILGKPSEVSHVLVESDDPDQDVLEALTQSWGYRTFTYTERVSVAEHNFMNDYADHIMKSIKETDEADKIQTALYQQQFDTLLDAYGSWNPGLKPKVFALEKARRFILKKLKDMTPCNASQTFFVVCDPVVATLLEIGRKPLPYQITDSEKFRGKMMIVSTRPYYTAGWLLEPRAVFTLSEEELATMIYTY